MGTHSRVGEYSPVQRIRGCTPVIAKIKEYLVNANMFTEEDMTRKLDEKHRFLNVGFLLSKGPGCCGREECASKGRDR